MSRGGGGTEGEKEVEEEVVRTRNQSRRGRKAEEEVEEEVVRTRHHSRRGRKAEQVDALFCFAQPKNL